MLDTTRPTKLTHGQLLEYSEDGKVISALEWNAVMNNLKTVINQNATVLSASKASASIVTISPDQWIVENSSTDPYGFYIDIPKNVHNIDGFCVVHTYDSELNQVLLNTKFDSTTKTVRLRSRVPASLTVLLQGVGAK